MLQCGFLGDTDWENEWFDFTSRGRSFMLLNLRVALERHRGIRRRVEWPRVKVELSREDAYSKLLSAGALITRNAEAALEAGETYSLTTPTGETFSGRVEFVHKHRGFA